MQAITDVFETCVSKYADNPLLWEKRTTAYEATTYAQAHKKVYQFAAGLMAIGVNKGDRVALMAEGCTNWLIGELGILYAGGINVPLSVRLDDINDVKFRLQHSGARMVVASANQARKISELCNGLEAIEKLIVFDESPTDSEKSISFAKVIELGQKFRQSHPDDFEQRWQSVQPSDYANICYTSGTTADPKGIILTHRNYTANVEQGLSLMPIPSYYVTLLLLPWDHAFAHTVGTYTVMTCGASIASVQVGKTPIETLKNVQTNIKEVKPHFLLSVPALAKNFRKNIEIAIRAKGIFTLGLYKLALKTAYTYNGIGFDKGNGWRQILKPLVKLFDKLLFSKVREAFGGRLEFFVGGGALLDIDLQRFFYAIGVPMYQGYGLSEASPVISSNAPMRHKLGSSGFLVANMDLKICDTDGNSLPIDEKGEIVIRGENVMAGYWNNPEATAESIKNGWLFTGDLGAMDKDGFLYVYGRFKSLLIADDGEKYSPEGIEEAIVEHSPYIDQIMLYNNQNRFTVALIVINKEAVKHYLKHHHGHVHHGDEQTAALKLIESELKEYRTGKKHGHLFPQRWLPSNIAILPEGFTENNQLLNSTMKMVRGKITDRYADLISYLYTPEAQDICHPRNMKVMKEMGFGQK
jgi:long-chain acyl-CoA synthetase